MLPAVTISKPTFSAAGANNASATGVLAVLAASYTGTTLQPGGFARSDLAAATYGYGLLSDTAAYTIDVANNPVVLCRGTSTYAGSYNNLNTTKVTGACVVSTTGTPNDRFAVVIEIVNGGTVGVTGITYTYSTDGGTTQSGVQALGTNTSISIPNTGVTFNLTSASLNANDTWSVFTTGPTMGDTDVIAGLTTLYQSRLQFEGAFVDCSATTSTVGLIDTFLAGQEAIGRFTFVIINSRFKTEPEPTGESEAAYLTALTTTFGNQSSIRICVGADGGHVPSQITGWNLKRPTGMLLAARAMSTSIGVDAAYVGLGPLTGVQVADPNGNPFDHDEDLYPGIDDQRLVALRTFAPGGPQGVYIDNANVIQPSGGQYPYLQHVRIMNRAATIAWATMTQQLSRGVRKNQTPDPTTGAVYIFEPDAANIDSIVNDALASPLKNQVNAYNFHLSRTDDLNAIPCVITATLEIQAFAYIKGVKVTATFVKTLTSTQGA